MAIEWDQNVYFAFPDGSAIVKASAAPCRGCGHEMGVWLSPGGQYRTYCGRCCKPRRGAPPDQYVGWLDHLYWRIATR